MNDNRDAIHDELKAAILLLLRGGELSIYPVGELELVYIPAREYQPLHRLWLSRPGGRVSYEESQAVHTALMAAIHADNHVLDVAGIDMAMDQATAGSGDTPEYATKFEWLMYRQMQLPLAERGTAGE